MADERFSDRRAARRAYARRNAIWLVAVFGVAIAAGLWLNNIAAIAGGALGIGWVLLALRSRS
ncbi:MAG: hypothetical protein ACFBRM_08360 [Pikeienuella sp.]